MNNKAATAYNATDQGELIGEMSFKNDITFGIGEMLRSFAELPRFKKLRIVLEYDPEAVNTKIKVYQQ